MNRQDWYTYKAYVLLENLNNEQNQILNKYFSSDSIFKCCIILNIMMDYYRCIGVYNIGENLENRFQTELPIEYIVDKLILPLCQKFVFGNFKVFDTFSIEDIYASFLQYILSLPLKDNTVINMLITYLGFTENKIIQDMIANRKPYYKVKIVNFFYNTNITMQKNFYITYKEIKKTNKTENLYDSLLNIKLALITLKTLKDSIIDADIDVNDKNYFFSECNKINNNIKEQISALSYIELYCLTNSGKNDDDKVIDSFIQTINNISIISQQMFPIFPEVYKNKHYIPQNTIDYVFAYNGRQRHIAIGVIPYCYVCDINDLSGFQKLGMSEGLSIKDNVIELNIFLTKNEYENIRIPYYYDLSILSDIHELLLIIKHKKIRFDILQIRNIKLRLAYTHILSIPDDITQNIKNIIMQTLKKQFQNNAFEFYNSLVKQKLTSDLDSLFMACESAKSEIFFNQYDNLQPDNTKYKSELNKYNTKKNEIYKLRKIASKITEKNKSNIENEIVIKKLELDKIAQEIFISRNEQDDCFINELKTISSTLPQDTCFMHFLLHDNCLDLLYIKKDSIVKRIDLSHVSIKDLSQLFYKWKDSKGAKRERLTNQLLKCIGSDIGIPIIKILKQENVEKIILSPTDFLDGIPFHCAIINNNQYLCDAFKSITYIPTLRLLYRLTKDTKRDNNANTITGVVNTDDGLTYAHKEADILRVLFHDKAQILICPDSEDFLNSAKSCKAIHIGTHANYTYGNFWDANLAINSNKNDNLTVAQIIADANFSNVQFVNLAACSSGLSSGKLENYRNYAGMDISFMIKGAKSVISTLWNVSDSVAFLYSCCLYWQLSKGKSIEDSHKTSIDYIKQNRYSTGKIDTELKDLLNTIYPDCEKLIDNNISKVIYWGCFKISGIGQNKIL